jgi:hypothetical protein
MRVTEVWARQIKGAVEARLDAERVGTELRACVQLLARITTS